MQDQPPYQPFGGGPARNLQPQEDNDKIVAALCYFFGFIVGIIVLVTDMKNKPFLKFHAQQSIVFGVALSVAWMVAIALSVVLIGFCAMPVLFVAQLYYAYLAYTKGIFTIPLITDLTAKFFPDFPAAEAKTL